MFSPVFLFLPKILPWIKLFTGCDTEEKHHWTPQERPGCVLLTPALGTRLCSGILCLANCRLCSQQCFWARTCVFWQGFFFCLYLQRYRIVQDSNMLRAIAFLGAKKRERQKKAHFLWQTFLQGFASLASFTWAFIPVYVAWRECLALIWGQTAP